VSVFLRWGIFGIIGVAALVYAYNASKRMAEKRASREPPVASASAPEAGSEPEPASTAPPHCQAELVVARRALEARREGEPLDRLLRIQEIAWQEPAARRRRLEDVATRWYQLEGEEPIPEALRIRVVSDCEHFSPAP
jgi:hypothetical protein